MAIEITHVRFGSSTKTEDQIVRYKWKSLGDGSIGESGKSTVIQWIDTEGGVAYVGSGAGRVNVGVVRPQAGQPYLRTYADGKWTNNLLGLPIF